MRTRKPRRLQLRTRVLAGVLSVTILALVAFDFAAVNGLRGYLVSQTDSRLGGVLSLYRPLSVSLPPATQARIAPHFVRAYVHGESRPTQLKIVGPRVQVPAALGIYWVSWVGAKGPRTFVAGNTALKPKLPPNLKAIAAGRSARTVASLHGPSPLRLLAARFGGGTIVATTSLGNVNRTVRRLELILIFGSLIAGLLVAFGVVMILRRGLRPIETMASQADRITAGDLTDRVSQVDPQTEVGRLATALNGMLARIEASVQEREASQELTRQFFADASHELRNPLASLRANAELYQQGALPHRPQVDEAMRRISLEARRMSVLVDDMLRLARLDQHPGQQRREVDLTEMIYECHERARVADPLRTWHLDVEPDLTLTGDEDQLRRAIDNLLANVRLHTPGDATGTICAFGLGSWIVVEVSDDGPGVPAERLPRIFDRFYRCEAPTRSPGSGLGLAIVSAVAKAHGGIATAGTSAPHGLRITLTLPVLARLSDAEPLAGDTSSDGAARGDERVLVSADTT
jgi:two-component system, OmpR family, sensor kinase